MNPSHPDMLKRSCSLLLICMAFTASFFATPTNLTNHNPLWEFMSVSDKPLGDYSLLLQDTAWRIHLYMYLTLQWGDRNGISRRVLRYMMVRHLNNQKGNPSLSLNNPWKQVAQRPSLKLFFPLWATSDTLDLWQDKENTNDRIYVFIYINHHRALLLFQSWEMWRWQGW